jgi:hypothetical protein
MSYLVAHAFYKFHMSITSDSLVNSNNQNMIMLPHTLAFILKYANNWLIMSAHITCALTKIQH